MVEPFDYVAARADAEELIEEFGQLGAIRRTPRGSGPAHNPGHGTPVNHPARFAVVEFNYEERKDTKILAGDLKVILSTAGLSIEPTTADQIIIGGLAYTIVNPKPLNPAGTVVLYEIQVRR